MPMILRSWTRSAVPLALLLATGCAAVGGQPAPRPARDLDGPVFNGQVTFAGGKYEHDIDGSFKDRTGAGYFGVLAEASTRSGLGGGIALEVMNSDDDLFEGQAPNDQQVGTFELDPYFLYRVSAGEQFRMPLRLGLWIHALNVDDQGSSDSLTWISVGLRLAAEPEVVLMRSPDFECSVFTAISLAGGSSEAHVESAAVDEDFDTEAGAFGLEVGPRFRFGH